MILFILIIHREGEVMATTILLIHSPERFLFDRQTKRKRENERRKEKRLVSVESFF
jgi:hypothetical protein